MKANGTISLTTSGCWTALRDRLAEPVIDLVRNSVHPDITTLMGNYYRVKIAADAEAEDR